MHLDDTVGKLPDLRLDLLKWPVQLSMYPEQLMIRGPLDGTGGARYTLSAAKLIIKSYIDNGCLPGWGSVSDPLLYKLVFDSETPWECVRDLSHSDLLLDKRVKSEQSESDKKGSQFPPWPGKDLLHASSSGSLGAGLSAQVVPYGDVATDDAVAQVPGAGLAAPGAGLAAQVPGAGLAAQAAIIARAGSAAWPPRQTASPIQCMCRGNCGDPLCKGVQNQKSRKRKLQSTDLICSRIPVPGTDFCKFCRCEFCDRTRSHCEPHGRWCSGSMRKNCGLQGKAPLAYTTRSGTRNFHPHWSRELKFVCKFNCALTLLDPGDLAVGHDTCAELWSRFGPPTPGQVLPTMVLFCLVWIHALKWPAAVLHFGRSLAEYTPSQDIAHDFVDMITASILHCHGQVWSDVFAGLCSGGPTPCMVQLRWGSSWGYYQRLGKLDHPLRKLDYPLHRR